MFRSRWSLVQANLRRSTTVGEPIYYCNGDGSCELVGATITHHLCCFRFSDGFGERYR
jgi:hypothetical protein